MDGKYLKSFNNLEEAVESLGIKTEVGVPYLSMVFWGRMNLRSVYGYRWKYG
jgi:hypothetical protein